MAQVRLIGATQPNPGRRPAAVPRHGFRRGLRVPIASMQGHEFGGLVLWCRQNTSRFPFMNTHTTLTAIFLLLCTPSAVQAGKAPRSPNILLIVADDLGYGELGCQGYHQDIQTPHIDRIARDGIRFTNGYATGPYCSPSRAGLITGRYQQRFGHEFNPGPHLEDRPAMGLALEQRTIGDLLRNEGYATGWFGKSHLGYAPEHHPLARGFDSFYGFLGASHSYHEAGHGLARIFRDREPAGDPGYLTDAIAVEAVEFITRNRNRPWLAYLPFNAVHAPLDVLKSHEKRYESIQDPRRRRFAALLSALDDAVGRVLGHVRHLGLEDETLIVFTSDNGGPTAVTTSSNGPLKGSKGNLSEGGIRVPFLIQWKGRLPAGTVDPRPVTQLDVLPTALAAAGVGGDSVQRLDGANLLPFLTAGGSGDPHQALFWRYGRQIAVRSGDWKLVSSACDGVPLGEGIATTRGARLHNLASDIGETIDLSEAEPEKRRELAALWEEWNLQLAEPSWPPGGQLRLRPAKPAPGGPWMEGDHLGPRESPEVAGRHLQISTLIHAGPDGHGVIVSQGGRYHGYALHVRAGRPVFSLRRFGVLTELESSKVLRAGKNRVTAVLRKDLVTLSVNGRIVSQAKTTGVVAGAPTEGLIIGNDRDSPVGRYSTPHPFSGLVRKVELQYP